VPKTLQKYTESTLQVDYEDSPSKWDTEPLLEATFPILKDRAAKPRGTLLIPLLTKAEITI
jgi:hypothetical protein